MKLMSRYVNGNTQTIALVNAAGEVNELNQFFNRFVCHDFSQKHRQSYVLNRASAEEDDFQRPCHFIQSHIRKVHAYLAVTCHQHFWQNDRDLLRATAVTRGWNG